MIVTNHGAFGSEAAERRHMKGEPAESIDPEQVAAARDYLGLCRPTKTLNYSSYGLKHWAEGWSADNGGVKYITNGALIRAALDLGLEAKLIGDGPNCMIGVGKRLPTRERDRKRLGGLRHSRR